MSINCEQVIIRIKIGGEGLNEVNRQKDGRPTTVLEVGGNIVGGVGANVFRDV